MASVHSPAKDADALLESLGNVGAISPDELEAIRVSPDLPYSTDVIFHALDRVKGEIVLVGGGWNNSRLFDAKMRDGRTTVTEFFARAAQAGWFECGGDRNEERSWLRDGDRTYQFDHLSVTPPAAPA